MSYGIPNDCFQEERFQKLDINLFHYLDWRQKETNHSNGKHKHIV